MIEKERHVNCGTSVSALGLISMSRLPVKRHCDILRNTGADVANGDFGTTWPIKN